MGQRSVPRVISLDMDDVAESVDVSNFFGGGLPLLQAKIAVFFFCKS